MIVHKKKLDRALVLIVKLQSKILNEDGSLYLVSNTQWFIFLIRLWNYNNINIISTQLMSLFLLPDAEIYGKGLRIYSFSKEKLLKYQRGQ